MFYILLCMTIGLAEKPRTWTSSDGKHKTKATFIEQSDLEVTLEKESGVLIKVKIDKLSKIDQNYLKRQPIKKPQPQKVFFGTHFITWTESNEPWSFGYSRVLDGPKSVIEQKIYPHLKIFNIIDSHTMLVKYEVPPPVYDQEQLFCLYGLETKGRSVGQSLSSLFIVVAGTYEYSTVMNSSNVVPFCFSYKWVEQPKPMDTLFLREPFQLTHKDNVAERMKSWIQNR